MDFLYTFKDSKLKNIEFIENRNITKLSMNNSFAMKKPVSYIYL